MFSKRELSKLSENELIDIVFKQKERLEKYLKFLKILIPSYDLMFIN